MDKNLSILEECYKKFINDLAKWAPEGVVQVDLNTLHKFGLLHYNSRELPEPALTRYFHVIEGIEKIILVNDQFVIWIVPDKMENKSVTFTLIALNSGEDPQLEMVFCTTGVYNTSHLVLRILEKFLHEIQENEELLNQYKKKVS